jgi:hypothetical protein
MRECAGPGGSNVLYKKAFDTRLYCGQDDSRRFLVARQEREVDRVQPRRHPVKKGRAESPAIALWRVGPASAVGKKGGGALAECGIRQETARQKSLRRSWSSVITVWNLDVAQLFRSGSECLGVV